MEEAKKLLQVQAFNTSTVKRKKCSVPQVVSMASVDEETQESKDPSDVNTPSPPQKNLSDILVNRELEAQEIVDKPYLVDGVNEDNIGIPDCIIEDWLYLGDVQHASSKNVVNSLGITHILNCTEEHLCYHIGNKSIKYARIALADVTGSNLYDYMTAAADFIDECNGDNKKKVLVHCAAGVSRSSSIVISYLMHRRIEWNEVEKECIDIIRKRLGYSNEMSYDSLTLSEAYSFAQSIRFLVCPNEGFLNQLERFERLHHDGKSTKADVIRTNGQGGETYEKIRALRKQRKGNENRRERKCVIL